MSTARRELVLLVLSRIFTVVGVILAILMAYLYYLHITNSTVVDLCSGMVVAGEVVSDSPEGLPTIRPSLFPPGVECSFYAGESAPRVTDFTSAGLEAFSAPLGLMIFGAIFKLISIRLRDGVTR